MDLILIIIHLLVYKVLDLNGLLIKYHKIYTKITIIIIKN